jgi:hypothetical protein
LDPSYFYLHFSNFRKKPAEKGVPWKGKGMKEQGLFDHGRLGQVMKAIKS